MFFGFLFSDLENLQVHFVEMDPWVVSDILRPNLEWTGFLDASVIHTVRVENFLEQAEHFVGMSVPLVLLPLPPKKLKRISLKITTIKGTCKASIGCS